MWHHGDHGLRGAFWTSWRVDTATLQEGNVFDSMEAKSNAAKPCRFLRYILVNWKRFSCLSKLSISKVWFAVWFARKSSASEMLLIQIPTPEPLPTTDLEMTNDLTRDWENHGEASRSWRERRWWVIFFNHGDVAKKTLRPETNWPWGSEHVKGSQSTFYNKPIGSYSSSTHA